MRNVVPSSELPRARPHQRLGLPRAVRCQDVRIVTHNAGESEAVYRVRSHQSHSLATAV